MRVLDFVQWGGQTLSTILDNAQKFDFDQTSLYKAIHARLHYISWPNTLDISLYMNVERCIVKSRERLARALERKNRSSGEARIRKLVLPSGMKDLRKGISKISFCSQTVLGANICLKAQKLHLAEQQLPHNSLQPLLNIRQELIQLDC